jgi:hypothetical protein
MLGDITIAAAREDELAAALLNFTGRLPHATRIPGQSFEPVARRSGQRVTIDVEARVGAPGWGFKLTKYERAPPAAHKAYRRARH